MKIESKYLDASLYWAWEWGEKAYQGLAITLIIVLGVIVLGVPIIVPVGMLIAGKSSFVCFHTGILLGWIWFVLLGCFASLGFKEHTPLCEAERIFFFRHEDFEKPRRLSTISKKYNLAMLSKRKANDLAFLVCNENRGYRRDNVHLAVMDSDHNMVFETSYPAGSKTVTDIQNLYAQIIKDNDKQ